MSVPIKGKEAVIKAFGLLFQRLQPTCLKFESDPIRLTLRYDARDKSRQ